ncbi:MAG: serine phosphatase RsbU (regulator of sigma subunit) [Arenicella sp.]
MNSVRRYFILLFCLLFGLPNLSAQIQKSSKPFLLENSTDNIVLLPYIEHFIDTSRTLDFESASSESYNALFAPHKKNLGFTESAVWFRFTFSTTPDLDEQWWFEVEYPLLDSVEMFAVSDSGDVQQTLAGDFLPFGAREINHRNFIFPIELKGASTFTYYFRVRSTSSVDLPIRLWKTQAFLENNTKSYGGLGLYYGVVLVMMLYNLFLFFTLRDKNYIYYVLIISAIGLFQFTFNGLGYEFLWRNSPYWNTKAIPFFIALMGFTLMNFTRNFLDMKRFSKLANRIMLVFQFISLTICFLVFLLPYAIVSKVVIGLGLLEIIMAIVAGVIGLSKGFKPARFFLIAWVAFLGGMFAQALRSIGVLPNNFATLYSAQIGSAIEVILLSIALADRINTMKSTIANQKLEQEVLKREQEEEKKLIAEQQKEDLEVQVKLRTAEVVQQSHEIEAQRDKLKEGSDQLRSAVTELSKTNRNIKNSIQYAQRIQNSILPTQSNMGKYLPKEHFVFYKPRDIVSGDFYWLANLNGYCYLVVADCTGHGVPGALMSVIGSSLLTQIVDTKNVTSPSEILNQLNQSVEDMLGQGVNGLGTSRDGMDLVLLRIDYPNKKVVYSGAKMSVFAVKENEVEEYKCDKFSIGGGQYRNRTEYSEKEIDISNKLSLYISTDGFLDQFGGEDNRKFSKKRFRKMLKDAESVPMHDQQIVFESNFQNWKQDYRQIDDVTVMGIQF